TRFSRDWSSDVCSSDLEYLREAREQKRRYVLIKRRATNEERKKLRQLPIFNRGRYKGGIIDNQVTIIRKRPNGDLLSRTLGYVRSEERRVGKWWRSRRW